MADQMTERRRTCPTAWLVPTAGLLLTSLTTLPAAAQHDVHRNRFSYIGRREDRSGEAESSTADQQDPETQFLLMLAALAEDDVAAAVGRAEAALKAGLPFERLRPTRDRLAPLYRAKGVSSLAQRGGRPAVDSRTDVGRRHRLFRMFWVRTARESSVQVRLRAPAAGPTRPVARGELDREERLHRRRAGQGARSSDDLSL